MYSKQSQRVIRKQGYAQASQARNLLANCVPDPSVVAATQSFPEFCGQKIVELIASEDVQFGCLCIPAGLTYYLLASVIPFCRFYAMYNENGVWLCSRNDHATTEMYRIRLEKHLKNASCQ